MEKLLIIDGNNLLFQMFYGMPSVIYNKRGWPIHGTIGFISYVIKEINLLEATKAIVVFDSYEAGERKELYPEYKGNRDIDWEKMEEKETPFSQEEDIKKALSYMGVKYIYSIGTEADDYIASIALSFAERGEVVISSFDSDFFQLISDRVSVLRFRGKASVMWNEKKFRDEYGFSPSLYPIYKAITGDTADNIKGIEGMGKKRTCSLMSDYERSGGWTDTSLPISSKNRLRENKDKIIRNINLIKFKGVDTKINEDELGFFIDKVAEGNTRVLENSGVFR